MDCVKLEQRTYLSELPILVLSNLTKYIRSSQDAISLVKVLPKNKIIVVIPKLGQLIDSPISAINALRSIDKTNARILATNPKIISFVTFSSFKTHEQELDPRNTPPVNIYPYRATGLVPQPVNSIGPLLNDPASYPKAIYDFEKKVIGKENAKRAYKNPELFTKEKFRYKSHTLTESEFLQDYCNLPIPPPARIQMKKYEEYESSFDPYNGNSFITPIAASYDLNKKPPYDLSPDI